MLICVVPIQPEEGCGWLNGHHTQCGWKRQGVQLTGWMGTHMDGRHKGYVLFFHSRVRPRFSQPHPALCFLCVAPIQPEEECGRLNGHHTQHGWKRQGVWLVECGHTHMDERGKGCVPFSLSYVCATPIQPAVPFSLSSILCVCVRHSNRGGVWLVDWAPHKTWMGETRGMACEWGQGHMDDKGKGTCPSLDYACVRPPSSQLYPSLCHPCYVCVAPIQLAVLVHYIDPCFVTFDVHMCQ